MDLGREIRRNRLFTGITIIAILCAFSSGAMAMKSVEGDSSLGTTAENRLTLATGVTNVSSSFSQSEYVDQPGNVIEISVSLETSGLSGSTVPQTWVLVGGPNAPIMDLVRVRDLDGDGTATFKINTFTVGRDSDPNTGYSTPSGETGIEVTRPRAPQWEGSNDPPEFEVPPKSGIDQPLQATSFPLRAMSSDKIVLSEDESSLQFPDYTDGSILVLQESTEEPNSAPTADAVGPRTATGGGSIELDATASNDPDGDSLSYTWKQEAPSTPTATINESGPKARAVLPAVDSQTEFTFRVTVRDGNGGSDTDSVIVAVAPESTPTPSPTPTPTPSPTPTPTPSSTPTPTPSPTPTPTPSPTPTPTTTTPPLTSTSTIPQTPATVTNTISESGSNAETTERESGGGIARIPIVGLGGLVILGVGAAGTLLYLRRNDRDDIPPANASGAESSPPEPPNKGAEGPPSSGSDNASEIKPTNSSKPSGLTASTGTDGPLSSGGGGPPKNVPRAPQLSVDYSGLKEGEPIGSGGNADVRRAIAQAPEGDVPLAIKTPRIGSTLQRGQVEQILSEAETWDKLDDNDHIVGVVDYGANPVPWIAMEYMDAGHLGDRAGALESDQALWTALAVTKGVRHAHRHGVAHLDLKPENILFRTVENAWNLPKVADWGLSKHLLDHSKSVEGLTPEYAAPEQFSDEFGTPDDLTDVYQLGAVFYALFTGQPPYKGPPARTMHQVLEETPRPPSEIAAIPDGLDDVLLKALAKDKDQRYEDIVYLRDELKDLYERF